MRLSTLSAFLLPVSHALPSTATSGKGVEVNIPEFFSEIATAKIWRVALDLLDEVSFLSLLLKYSNSLSAARKISRKGPQHRPQHRRLCPRRCHVLDIRLLPGFPIQSVRPKRPLSQPLSSKQPQPIQNPQPAIRSRSAMDRPSSPAGVADRHP